ncbi:Crp/Fnr family transcriptional regulator [Sphingomicrobium lutaoense]|uniref:CRP-like cAMP-binding protein n=1 Tax=Sphingomicrobium lutaoense TaxID=515949 RepID=A0A839Z1M1_9SPHN|nr:Crp/Fnr family transcriptional regulator [Sphingomicrobium lutaoense]MBB3763572.1 CRP-like cAMP-binding protein [Sphingomicrobium lutaoense]
MARGDNGVDLKATLIKVGLDEESAEALAAIPHKTVQVDPRRAFREPGSPRDEVMFVRSGILCKYKSDGSGRRQIVSLRFPGEGILPSPSNADYGLQAIVRSEVMVGKAEDFYPIVQANPAINPFLFRLVQREASISHEWLLNCGRRDSATRVAHFLCEVAARTGVDGVETPLKMPFTQQQIADITGQTSVNVNRVFADLERRKLIRREGRTIFFLDPVELQRVGSFNPSYLLGQTSFT